VIAEDEVPPLRDVPGPSLVISLACPAGDVRFDEPSPVDRDQPLTFGDCLAGKADDPLDGRTTVAAFWAAAAGVRNTTMSKRFGSPGFKGRASTKSAIFARQACLGRAQWSVGSIDEFGSM
jgi:hypothetical protein